LLSLSVKLAAARKKVILMYKIEPDFNSLDWKFMDGTAFIYRISNAIDKGNL